MKKPIKLTLLLAIGTLCAAAPPRPAPPAPASYPFGVSWYPEQFPEREWAGELASMKRAHITFVRIAEFSWSTLEPSEGRYDFAWLDRAIALAAANGIKVVIGTPTAAPPAWLTQKYPDVLAVDVAGRRAEHGWRRQGSVASPRYRKLAAAIAAKLAERYGRNRTVIAWQIDNEYGRETWDDVMGQRFQQWLRARYGTLDAFNRAQFNTYWSLTYSSWDQIRMPRDRAQPALWLDWLRFGSDMWAEFQQNQIDAMRPHLAAGVPITTNYVAKYAEYDWNVPAQALDFVGWDWYFEEPEMIPADGAMQHDIYRGFLKRNVWVMETAAGTQNGAVPSYFQPKGETRAMAWQAIGHGADGYAYWVWRSPLNGTETPHGSMVDADGRPRPIFDEIAQAGGEIAKAWPALRGSTPIADVAMIYDFPNRWAIERQPLTKDYDVWRLFTQYRAALTPLTQGVDVQSDADGLARYKLVVAPNLFLLSGDKAAKLLDYAQGGGHLVIGARSGTKDEQSTLTRGGQLAPIAAAIGMRIDMSYPPGAPIALAGPLGTATARIWAERVVPDGPAFETLYRYGAADGWLDGAAAVVSRRIGKGRITYVGAWLDEPALNRLIAWAAEQAGARPNWPRLPDGVEVDRRRGPGGDVLVTINWAKQPRTVSLPRPMHDLIGDRIVRSVTLDHFGVAVLRDDP